MEKKELPVELVIPADKVAFMKESIEKLRALNRSDYEAGEFDSYNHKNEGRYNSFEEVLQWANPLKFYEEEKSILQDEMTNLSKELQQKDAQLQEAEEKIKQITSLLEKNFKDYLECHKCFTEQEIEEGWQRYKVLNNL